jgi:hypothetical protein
MLSRMIRWSFADVVNERGEFVTKRLSEPGAAEGLASVRISKRGSVSLRRVDILGAMDLLARINGWYPPRRVVYEFKGLGEITPDQARRLEAGEPWLEVLFPAAFRPPPVRPAVLTFVDAPEKARTPREGDQRRRAVG